MFQLLKNHIETLQHPNERYCCQGNGCCKCKRGYYDICVGVGNDRVERPYLATGDAVESMVII